MVFSQQEVDVGDAAAGSTVPIGETLYLGSLPGAYVRERDDLGDFMNHSCGPTCWMGDEVTLARFPVSGEHQVRMVSTAQPFQSREFVQCRLEL